MIYLDNSATTKPYPDVIEAVANAQREHFANASALYRLGLEAENAIADAKQAIAGRLGCREDEVLLTPGGTYSNNFAVLGAARVRARRGNRVVLTAVEHPSVYACGKKLEEEGFEVVYASPTWEGLSEAINAHTVLVAVMMVNNETGLILPVDRVAALIRQKNAPAHFHIDGVQAFAKLPTPVKRLQCDSFSLSAHKIKGPKGIGALYLKKGVRLLPLLLGGEQEGGLVPGTYNNPAAAGLAKAVGLFLKEDLGRFEALRARLLARAETLPFIRINSPKDGVPYIVNLSVMGYLGENVLHFLEQREIYVSQGSACSSRAARSHTVLARLGEAEPVVMGALRISFGVDNTIEEVDQLMDALAEVPQKIQKRYKDVNPWNK